MGCALGSADIRAIAIAGWCDGAVSTILTAADSVGGGKVDVNGDGEGV